MLRSGDIDECQTRNESNPDNLSTLSYPKNENLKKDCRNEIPQKDPIITKNVGAGDNKVCKNLEYPKLEEEAISCLFPSTKYPSKPIIKRKSTINQVHLMSPSSSKKMKEIETNFDIVEETSSRDELNPESIELPQYSNMSTNHHTLKIMDNSMELDVQEKFENVSSLNKISASIVQTLDNSRKFDTKKKFAKICTLNKSPASIVQEYASKHQLSPQYNLIYNGISQAKVTFKYSLTMGEYTTVGEATSKKKAKHVAAREFLKLMVKNNPHILETAFKNCNFENHIDSSFSNNIKMNAVGRLNDMCTNIKYPLPEFFLVREEGEAHARLFTVHCYVAKLVEEATHKTKRQAKHSAALQMVNKLASIRNTLVASEFDSTSIDLTDSIKVMQLVEDIKSDNIKKNPPMDANICNYHLLFKNHNWPNTNALEALVHEYVSNNHNLNIDDPWSVLNVIVKECEMKLTVKIMDRNVIVHPSNLCCMISIDNIYPSIYGVAMAGDEESANKHAALELLKNMCMLYL